MRLFLVPKLGRVDLDPKNNKAAFAHCGICIRPSISFCLSKVVVAAGFAGSTRPPSHQQCFTASPGDPKAFPGPPGGFNQLDLPGTPLCHPEQMLKPPQSATLDTNKQRLYSRCLSSSPLTSNPKITPHVCAVPLCSGAAEELVGFSFIQCVCSTSPVRHSSGALCRKNTQGS